MTALLVILALLAACGHVAISVYLNNRLHAQGWPRGPTKLLSAASHAFNPIGAVAVTWGCIVWLPAWSREGTASISLVVFSAYVAVCCLVALGPLPVSLWQRRSYRPPAALRSNHSRLWNLAEDNDRNALVGPGWRRCFVRIPGNEMLRIEINEKRLALSRLAPALEGLSIVHLSDLHFTGVISRRFFERAVEAANALEPDFVAITGDLLDKTACIDWVPYTLGRLRARHGAFFVLGNHDLRVDWRRLRETLEDAGVVDLGGRSTVAEVNGCPILLAGNEMPWFSPAPTLPADEAGAHRSLRIVLSHSPDQIVWARQHGFDLLLAGHNHGGQICLPVVGPVFSPSRYGVRYAGGVFDLPPTLMHVSRGLSGKTPVRYKCPPELTKLVLTGRPAEYEGHETERSLPSQ